MRPVVSCGGRCTGVAVQSAERRLLGEENRGSVWTKERGGPGTSAGASEGGDDSALEIAGELLPGGKTVETGVPGSRSQSFP